MAHIIELKDFTDQRGSLIAIEDKILGFPIKRVFYIYGAQENVVRGKHRHKKTRQAMVCVRGSCLVYNNDGKKEDNFLLDTPKKCLILEPKDWHSMTNFTKDCIIQVLASENFNSDDYIYESYSSE